MIIDNYIIDQKSGSTVMKKFTYTLLLTTGLACFAHQGYAQNDDKFIQTEQAAKQGDAKAQFGLGLMYDRGIGVKKDNFKAVEWYTKAANQGYAKAQSNLASMYVTGEGVPLDYKQVVQSLK